MQMYQETGPNRVTKPNPNYLAVVGHRPIGQNGVEHVTRLLSLSFTVASLDAARRPLHLSKLFSCANCEYFFFLFFIHHQVTRVNSGFRFLSLERLNEERRERDCHSGFFRIEYPYSASSASPAHYGCLYPSRTSCSLRCPTVTNRCPASGFPHTRSVTLLSGAPLVSLTTYHVNTVWLAVFVNKSIVTVNREQLVCANRRLVILSHTVV